ncbi:hypothetical protein [Kitasatospora griseola]|uniref:hypothetical protein n=1 Tax=Kitasatospora griseola TaxID=2064 RepID=UPI00341446B9
MPEYYSSIGEAVGAAMQHNIRLARGPESGPPLQVRQFPLPSSDPYSMPGMIARLEVTATPQDVAGIVEETTGALVGPLPQLTELVAATADWARARLNFDDPDHNPAFDLWTRLASAHYTLTLVQADLESAIDGIAALPTEPSDPRHHDKVEVKRTRELLHDVMSDRCPDAGPEAGRQQAALAHSPSTAPRRAAGQHSSASAAAPAPTPGARTTGYAR